MNEKNSNLEEELKKLKEKIEEYMNYKEKYNKGNKYEDPFTEYFKNFYKRQKSTEESKSFSQDIEIYKDDVKRLINYLKVFMRQKEFSLIYIKRSGTQIKYGRKKLGIPQDEHTIEMTSQNDLQRIYNQIKLVFADCFVKGSKHEFSNGLSLLPSLGKNIILEIDSDNAYDQNWFSEESKRDLIIDLEPSEYEIRDVKINQKK